MYQTKVLSELGDLTTLVNENWKILIDEKISKVIDFIEIHQPKRLLEKDTEFVIQSLSKIEDFNDKMLNDLLLYSHNRSEQEKLLMKLVTENLRCWLDEKRNIVRTLKL